MEQITDAAIVFTVFFPESNKYDTVILMAERHADCFERASRMFPNRYIPADCKQGFWTDHNRFLDRYDAKKLALESGQLKEDTGYAELYSEDLW